MKINDLREGHVLPAPGGNLTVERVEPLDDGSRVFFRRGEAHGSFWREPNAEIEVAAA